jgi:hypothetical protein
VKACNRNKRPTYRVSQHADGDGKWQGATAWKKCAKAGDGTARSNYIGSRGNLNRGVGRQYHDATYREPSQQNASSDQYLIGRTLVSMYVRTF